MKIFAILLIVLVGIDFAFLQGAYTNQAWGAMRSGMYAIRGYADDHTQVIPRS